MITEKELLEGLAELDARIIGGPQTQDSSDACDEIKSIMFNARKEIIGLVKDGIKWRDLTKNDTMNDIVIGMLAKEAVERTDSFIEAEKLEKRLKG